MRVHDLNWMQVERYLEQDDRIVLPLGSTEQHAYLSLGTDSILAERVAVEAAQPLGVPVLPALPYGLTPTFAAYPGSPTLTEPTYFALLRELLGSLSDQGFRRFLVVNGHGGNAPAEAAVTSWAAEVEGVRARWHDWWSSPRVRSLVDRIDPEAGHASWMESFPWTRLPGVDLPNEHKPRQTVPFDVAPAELRRRLGDGSFGGWYQRPDDELSELWRAGVAEVRELLVSGWNA
jgi:creatinine amidohydrolase